MPLWSSSLAQDTMQYEFESTETVSPIGDLAGTSATTGLGVAQITDVSFEGLTTGSANNKPAYTVGGSGTLATAFVRVTWNEPVDFTESTMPSLVVTHTKDADDSEVSYTATAPAGNTTVNTMEAVGTDWDTIRMNSSDGSPGTDAGDRIIIEDDTQSGDGDKDHLQMETQTTGTQMNFYFTIAGSNANGVVSIARQAITLNSSTFKEAGDTETADSGIMQQVAADILTATVTTT